MTIALGAKWRLEGSDGIGSKGSRVVAPNVEAVITSTATVSTASFDPDVSDNSATGSIIVGPPVEEVPTI